MAGTTQSSGVGNRRQVKQDESLWFKILNHHPAIIGQAAFDAVQRTLNAKGEPLRKRDLHTSARYAKMTESPLKGKMVCGHCGHGLRISCTKNAAFHCGFSRSAADAGCHGLRLLKNEAETAVLGMMKKQAKRLLLADGSDNITEAERSEFTMRIALCQDEKRNLYERLICGELLPDDYKADKAKIDLELSRLEQAGSQCKAQAEKKKPRGDVRESYQAIVRARTLRQDMVDALVKKVLVYPGGRLEILWNDNINFGG